MGNGSELGPASAGVRIEEGLDRKGTVELDGRGKKEGAAAVVDSKEEGAAAVVAGKKEGAAAVVGLVSRGEQEVPALVAGRREGFDRRYCACVTDNSDVIPQVSVSIG